MELEQSIWQISIIALIAGGLIGVFAYRYFIPSEKEFDRIKTELEQARAELQSYRAGVSEHFDKTGELVNELAQNYVKVYRHLAEGAETLGAGKTFPELLEQQSKAALENRDDSINADDKPAVSTGADDRQGQREPGV